MGDGILQLVAFAGELGGEVFGGAELGFGILEGEGGGGELFAEAVEVGSEAAEVAGLFIEPGRLGLADLFEAVDVEVEGAVGAPLEDAE